MQKENKTKLIYILNEYSHSGSSHFFHIIHLLEKIAERNVEIALIIEKSIDIPSLAHPDIKVYPISSNKLNRIIILFRYIFKLNRSGYKILFIRISWVAAIVAIICSWFTNQKTFFWNSGQGTIEYFRSLNWNFHKLKLWIKTILPFWFIKKYISFLVTGPESMAHYFNQERNVPLNKIKVLYNDIDLSRFSMPDQAKKKALKQDWHFPQNKQLILFVHHMSFVRKTAYYLPYILDKFFTEKSGQIVHFIIAGDGPEKEGIKKAVEKSNYSQHVQFIGNVANAEIDRLYQCADLFIQPTFAEGFPRTLLEAMACGLPMVTTNAGGIKDLLGRNQKRFMVDIHDRENFANKLIQLSSNPEMMDLLSNENLQTVLKFDTQQVAKMYVSTLFSETE